MKSWIKKIAAAVVLFAVAWSATVKAEATDRSLRFHLSADLVSSYIWRGMYQTGASIQPTFGLSIGGFSLTAWGSTDFDGNPAIADAAENPVAVNAAKEIDLTAAYTFGNSGLTVSVADLWWAGQKANRYFNFKSHETAHHFEAGLTYTLPLEKFPLSLAWYTMFAGLDKDEKGDQNYSSYVELNFPFSIHKVDLNATCGIVPYEAAQYNTNRLAVTNVALKSTTAIRITDSFSLPVFAQMIWNPRMEDAHLVFGITLRP